MSRSYYRFYVHKDREKRGPHRYRAKTLANRAVRRSEISGGKSAFKRVYNSWDICDYRIIMEDLKQLRVAWDKGDPFLRRCYYTLDEAERDWKTRYIRK